MAIGTIIAGFQRGVARMLVGRQLGPRIVPIWGVAGESFCDLVQQCLATWLIDMPIHIECPLDEHQGLAEPVQQHAASAQVSCSLLQPFEMLTGWSSRLVHLLSVQPRHNNMRQAGHHRRKVRAD